MVEIKKNKRKIYKKIPPYIKSEAYNLVIFLSYLNFSELLFKKKKIKN